MPFLIQKALFYISPLQMFTTLKIKAIWDVTWFCMPLKLSILSTCTMMPRGDEECAQGPRACDKAQTITQVSWL